MEIRRVKIEPLGPGNAKLQLRDIVAKGSLIVPIATM